MESRGEPWKEGVRILLGEPPEESDRLLMPAPPSSPFSPV
ncbi:hypothetical protein SGL43_01263 [Streptomyces globisporus]|uniref:Uncharacterized protein n=1 Tax=Streptomyces globisporus TaxID=1908 RepID=A0ABN8UXJ5_STRGL|nr:hypothetical protein SGL43_01263 [Streptomyces globisporus]